MAPGKDLAVASATTFIVVQLLFPGVRSAVFFFLCALKDALGLNLLETLALRDLLSG